MPAAMPSGKALRDVGSGRLLRGVAALLLLSIAGCTTASRPVERGLASWHGPGMFSRESQTASGRKWWNWQMVAAHRTLPMGTTVRVVNEQNGRKAKVRIIDRGPYIEGRIIDVSPAAARKLGMKEAGLAPVRVEVLRLP